MNIYYNGKFLVEGSFHEDVALLEENGKIVEILSHNNMPTNVNRIDLQGNYVAPAFIDLQIYGGNGKMFSEELSLDSLTSTYEYSLAGGASQIMITIATNSMEVFEEGIEQVREYIQSGRKGLLGLHLEGPYLNPVKKGAHIERYIKRPEKKEVEQLLKKGEGVIRMMTIAPEQCDREIIELLKEAGVLISAGHSNATYDEAMTAFKAGIPTCTHLFNAMSGLQHRSPGLVGAIYDDKKVKSSIVADGIHVDFAAVRISYTIMKERLFFITDAVAAVDNGEYPHVFKGDRYTLPDGTLSGSALTMMQCVRNGVIECGIPLERALEMASEIPASLTHRSGSLGKIRTGFDCELVVFDTEFNVRKVIS
ncbi:MAG TPA: N-acetylglucosamine-6-phosphate deacetylase [Flavitalea sp.]|nr:N-acetylglucosamine-6-phosphate deacetylase [Flavitalea sp.]